MHVLEALPLGRVVLEQPGIRDVHLRLLARINWVDNLHGLVVLYAARISVHHEFQLIIDDREGFEICAE